MKACKACGSTTRKLSAPGPRCATCHRERKAEAKNKSHEAYVLKTYGLKAGEYAEILRFQGGFCYICQRASGRTKRLAVDHDHGDGYVRGILCGPCNKILGHYRDEPAAFERAAEYLRNPPAHRAVGKRKPE